MKLYHYVHCPYCIRVRMVLGLLGIEYESVVVPYDDEKTPIDLIQKKMLPILIDGEKIMPESLDIIKYLDQEDKTGIVSQASNLEFWLNYLDTIAEDVYGLSMPYFIFTKEFSESARRYFEEKKAIKRGSFKSLYEKRKIFTQNLEEKLKKLENALQEEFLGPKISICDIVVASLLWGLYIVPEFQFSEKIDNYLKAVERETKFEYHRDFWR